MCRGQCRIIFVIFCTAALLWGLTTVPALSESRTFHFELSNQSLSQALRSFGQIAGQEIIFTEEVVAGRGRTSLKGDFTAEEALNRLLQGTGLTAKRSPSGAVMIMSRESSEAADSPRSDQSTQNASSGSSDDASTTKEAGKKTSQDFRVAQVGQTPAGHSTVGSNNQNPANSQNGGPALTEIIVTAEKRAERLIDTPQSVSVLSSDDLSRLGAVQFRDFANTVPGLDFFTTGAGVAQVSLRGVTAGTDVSPTVGIYVDEVPYGSSTKFAGASFLALDVGLFDMDRIEILRGPQGTLYGASTMGGLLKYVSKRPDTQNFGGDVQTGISSTRDGGVNYNASAAVNLPVVADKVGLRLSGFESHDGGYIDNVALDRKDVNRSDTYGGRLDLLATPNESLTIRVAGFLQNISRDGSVAADYSASGVPLYGSLDQLRKLSEPFDQHFRLISGTINYSFGPAALTSIANYQTASTLFFSDVTPLFLPVVNSSPIFGGPYSAVGLPLTLTTNKVTQEVRLASEGRQMFDWVIGGFYTRENSNEGDALALLDAAGQPVSTNLLTGSNPSRYQEYAAFGDVTWHLTRSLDVTGGLRLSRNDQSFSQNGSGLFGNTTPTRDSNENVVTYLANALYHFNDHATGYLRYATGYRPGGPNYLSIDPTTGRPVNAPATFQADKLKSYEAGYKAETSDRRYGIDVATYYGDWQNPQLTVVRGPDSVSINAAGGATVRGAELTLTARPLTGLTASGAFAYQNAYLNEADADLGATRGERLPNVPRFTATLSSDYVFAQEGLRPAVGATLRYVDARPASFNGSISFPQYHLPDYTMVDLRSGISVGPVALQLFIHNLFDKRSQLSVTDSYGIPYVDIAQPRTIGVTATAHF